MRNFTSLATIFRDKLDFKKWILDWLLISHYCRKSCHSGNRTRYLYIAWMKLNQTAPSNHRLAVVGSQFSLIQYIQFTLDSSTMIFSQNRSISLVLNGRSQNSLDWKHGWNQIQHQMTLQSLWILTTPKLVWFLLMTHKVEIVRYIYER